MDAAAGTVPCRKEQAVSRTKEVIAIAEDGIDHGGDLGDFIEIVGDLVRCKDCKHYNGEDRDICCPLADYAQFKCGADWFCADGERKEAEHEQG